MKQIIASALFFVASSVSANAESIPECMVHAKTLQNPSALAGAAEVCMEIYFDSLRSDAEACRAEAATRSLPGAEFAACQAELILGLLSQVDACRREGEALVRAEAPLTARVSAGAALGCNGLVTQATSLCRENAGKFIGIAEAAATKACEAAGL